MRIVAGTLRGRPLRAVPGLDTRPTSDRVRQSLFDLLGQRFDGLTVLDLYAGTGALALEALSRGATHATLVESARAAQQVIERNAADLGVASQVTLMKTDVERALAALGARGAKFDLVFADPPYALQASQWIADQLAARDLLNPAGRAVIERGKREAPPEPEEPLRFVDERTWGDTVIAVLERPGAASI